MTNPIFYNTLKRYQGNPDKLLSAAIKLYKRNCLSDGIGSNFIVSDIAEALDELGGSRGDFYSSIYSRE